ncbi:hypothetical protein PIB30_077679 [Stylosanthes scabra]|uniref:Dynein light chain n=1 Tax=Stylosanthes scabra TaxID=79078 RepID=A0ABU6QQP6_9FABA|nr:hypothetical protein [Stylosanthes scabra]
MPHRSTTQLNLAVPPPPQPPHPYPTHHHHPTPNPDLTLPYYKPSFILKHLSSLAIAHNKPPSPHKHSLPPPPPPPPSPPHLKSKPMPPSCSFFSDFSKNSIATVVMRPRNNEKERNKPTEKKAPTKEKLKKRHGEQERRKLEDVKVVEKHDVGVKRHSVSLAPPPPLPPSNGGGGEGSRRSFCGGSLKVDLGDVFAVNGVRVVSADMPPFMQIHAVDSARKAFDSMEKFTSKSLASTLKKEFDGVYGPAWHCIVGTNFGSFVTHSVGGFLYFSMDQKFYILLFKTSVQKAG